MLYVLFSIAFGLYRFGSFGIEGFILSAFVRCDMNSCVALMIRGCSSSICFGPRLVWFCMVSSWYPFCS